jgi:sigma-B regulation protein RsbU (phosphoserine phosphatase)
MLLPIFQGEQVVEWCASFSRDGAATGVTDYLNALMTANLVSLAVENRQTLTVVQRLNRRLRDQFDDVARLQQALLPQRTPAIPGLSISTSYLTSDQAGGDYYDFIPLPDGRWIVLIADVSGHGAAAASVMAMLHAIVHGFDPRGRDGADALSPGALLAYANQRLASAGLEGNFVTAFLGVYDPRARTLDYASAGHNPPRLRLASGEVRSVDAGGSVPLGVLEAIEPPVARVTLAPEDTLVLYTDGIVEAFDERRSMFGLERLDAALRECSGRPECVIDHVHSALFAHTRSRERDDDQTLVALQATG